MALVELDIAKFRAMRPEFTTDVISDETFTALWGFACDVVGNTEGKELYPYDLSNGKTTRAYLLYLVLCHLATLHLWPAGQSGRVASASEGSVSTSFETLKANSFTGQYWTQTQCGATYWMLTAPYRRGGRFYGEKVYHPYG